MGVVWSYVQEMAARTFGFSIARYPEFRRNQQSGPSLWRVERGGPLVTCARDFNL